MISLGKIFMTNFSRMDFVSSIQLMRYNGKQSNLQIYYISQIL